jgi:periplasmic divalent cation tolerance protein
MTDKIVVLSTCATEADAERLARALVEVRLAACVNVVPGVRSFYHWKGQLDSGAECLMIIKTSRQLFPALCTEMEKLHAYEVPELLALPVVAGAENYLVWLDANLRGAQAGAQPGAQAGAKE